jgi:hypothetical protein
MSKAFVGTEAIRLGRLTRGQLRWNYQAVLPDVYIAKKEQRTVALLASAAWLWTGRDCVIAGRAAAALHGAKWIDASTPVDVIGRNRRRQRGVTVRAEHIDPDEIMLIGDVPVTTPARTALDLGRHLPRDIAVTHLDALANATGVRAADASALIERYSRTRGIRHAATSLALMDGGAQSPRETWLRLLLIDAGLPRPRTQIEVTDGINRAFIDMGYDEPKVGLDYEGEHHSSRRDTYVHDIGRAEMIERGGWIDIKVVAEHSRAFILHRVREAFARRGWIPTTSTLRS